MTGFEVQSAMFLIALAIGMVICTIGLMDDDDEN